MREQMMRELQKGGNIYGHFPFVFADAVPEVSLSQLRILSVSALFFLQHVLLSDELLDESHAAHFLTVTFNNEFHALAWQMLAKAGGRQPLPWGLLGTCYHEYIAAVLAECREHRESPRPFSEQDLIEVVSRRCAASKIISRALCFLGKRPDLAPDLDRSLDHYWVADCMRDDWRDWRSDLREKRYSYFLTRAIHGAGGAAVLTEGSEARRLEVLGKYIYGSGFLLSYLQEMSDFVERAREAVTSSGCNRWYRLLGRELVLIHSQRSHLLRGLVSLQLDGERCTCWLARSRMPRACDRAISHAPTLLSSAQTAIDFLLKNYRPGIGFDDFVTAHGQPLVWVSAYVGSVLQSSRNLVACGDSGRQAALQQTLSSLTELLASQHRDGRWSLHAGMPADADTTAWTIRFLRAARGVSPQLLSTASLSRYQRPDGGFSRFLPEEAGEMFAGWAISHPEITGLVVETLLQMGARNDTACVPQARDYLLRARQDQPLWRSYWWEGTAYASFHCFNALRACGGVLAEDDEKQIFSEICRCQDKSGSWGEALRGRSTAFETAYSLRLLLRLRATCRVFPALLRGVKWLLLHQLKDGSWISDPMLRLPHGADRQPEKFNDWKLDAPLQCGALLRDHRRLFTTASALAAVVDLINIIGDHTLIRS
ncbi:MAG TPA: prenyltransferase/squalene oxidase repeat-containing protein [Candidatus Acidoferrales bacterium]|nr:prenyltransferase/squalene oxidase repeat-containing protein [Candidatus Acidoferrales bacterium]